MSKLTFERFRDTLAAQGCVSRADILAQFPHFDKNNLGRWCNKGCLVKLRNGFYAFPEWMQFPDFKYVIANKIYGKSYVSLHSALIFHRYLSPQLQTQISSVSPLKTYNCRNFFGRFGFQTLRKDLIFGYENHSVEKFAFRMATPEKAIVDLFYLYPTYYDSEEDLRSFAIEEQRLFEDFNVQTLYEILQQFKNQALEDRISLFLSMYF